MTPESYLTGCKGGHDGSRQPSEIAAESAADAAVPESVLHRQATPGRGWVGRDFARSGYYGLRVLMLSERPVGSPPPAAAEAEAVAPGAPDARHRQRFWLNLTNVLGANTAQPKDGDEFWQSVAFSCYFRDRIPAGQRVPPAALWSEAVERCSTLLAMLQPDLVVAVGYRLYEYLPKNGTPGPVADTRLYKLGGRQILAARIKNALAPGFRWEDEAFRLKRALTAAKLLKIG
jgi:hypothetical protein